jgi:Fe2+ or Zn2+ uptake regulation protein
MEGHLEAVIAARDEVSALLKAKHAQCVALEAEILALTTEVEGLNLYIARHGVPVSTVPPEKMARWRAMPRTDAIIEALQEMNSPGSPKEISEWLRSTGREDDPTDVSRALNRLKEQHRVESHGHGLWAPVEGTVDQRPRQEETSATSESSDTDVAGRNRQDMHAKSSNMEPMSSQPLADDAPVPKAGGIDSLKPAADPALRWSRPPNPSIRDAVLTVIQPGEDVTIGVVTDRLKDKYVGVKFNRNSVSNELGRWAKEGKLERPAIGVYRVIRHANPPSPH